MHHQPTRTTTRRELLRRGLMLAPMAALLTQACGGSGQAPPNPPTAVPQPPTAAPPQPAPTSAPAKPTSAASQPTPAPAGAAGTPKRGGVLLVGKTTEAPSLEPHRENALSRARHPEHVQLPGAGRR